MVPAVVTTARREAAAFSVSAAAITLFASFLLPALLGYHQWMMSRDTWWTVGSARWISAGALGTVYQANPWWSALPGFPILLAPVVAVGDHLGLVGGYPYAIAYPSLWLLVGPVFALTGAISVYGVNSLAGAIGLPASRRRVLLGCYALLVVPPTILAGHPEDLAALGMVCWAFALQYRGRAGTGAWALAGAVLLQTWVGLALPLYVAIAPGELRLRVGARAAGPPAAVGGLLLALDWRHASADLLGQPMPNTGQHLPWWSIARWMTVNDQGKLLHVVAGSSTRWMAVVGALVVAAICWKTEVKPSRAVLLGLAVVFMGRGLFETEVWPYYLAPAAVALAAAGLSLASRWRATAVCLCCLVLYGSCGMAYVGVGLPVWPWLAVTFGSGTVGVLFVARGELLSLEQPARTTRGSAEAAQVRKASGSPSRVTPLLTNTRS